MYIGCRLTDKTIEDAPHLKNLEFVAIDEYINDDKRPVVKIEVVGNESFNQCANKKIFDKDKKICDPMILKNVKEATENVKDVSMRNLESLHKSYDLHKNELDNAFPAYMKRLKYKNFLDFLEKKYKRVFNVLPMISTKPCSIKNNGLKHGKDSLIGSQYTFLKENVLIEGIDYFIDDDLPPEEEN